MGWRWPLTGQERVFSVALGVMFGWLALLETGLSERRDAVAVALSVLLLAVSVAVAWVFVRWSYFASPAG